MRWTRPAPRDEFRKRLRADLMNEAVALAEERRLRRPSRFMSVLLRLRPVAVAATLVAMLIGGAGVAAAGSVPGDPAFGLKRAAEEIELALAPDDDAKVRVLTAQAERRLEELGRTTTRPEKAPTASAEYEAAVRKLAAAVTALRAAPADQRREAVEQVVEAARDKHVQVLEELKERLPEGAKRGIERALEQQHRIAPARPEDRTRDQQPERPRASETPRGGRPSATPPRAPSR
jgi:hypothetical protein